MQKIFLCAFLLSVSTQPLYSVDPLTALVGFVVASTVALIPTAATVPKTVYEWWSKKSTQREEQALQKLDLVLELMSQKTAPPPTTNINVDVGVGNISHTGVKQSSNTVPAAPTGPATFATMGGTREPSAGTIPVLPEENFLTRFNSYIPSYSSATNYIRSHKRDLLIKTVICGYLAINSLLVYTSTQLHRADCWSCWRQELSLPALMDIKQQDLAQGLYAAIRQRYSCSEDSISQNTLPMNLFLKSIEHEQALLLRYRRLCALVHSIVMAEQAFLNYSGTFFRSCCNRVGLGWMPSIGSYMFSHASLRPLFFIDESLETHIDDKINRLAYLKTVLFTWMVDRQLVTHTTHH